MESGVFPADADLAIAVRSGFADLLDLEDIGIDSNGSYAVHFTEDGTHAGATATISGDFDAISRFRDETFIRRDDGTAIDRATGRNARLVQDGHKFFYFTWP